MAWELIRRRTFWIAALSSGVVAGIVFLVLDMGLRYIVHGQSPWMMPRMIAAMVLGPEVLPPPATFDAGIIAVAMAVHFGLSTLYATMGELILHRLRIARAMALGALLGLVLYLINFYGFVAWFPWFAEARDGVTLTVHIVYGAVQGYECKRIMRRWEDGRSTVAR